MADTSEPTARSPLATLESLVEDELLEWYLMSPQEQCDKGWIMIRRLLEASYARGSESPTAEQVSFWLTELRTPELLIECAAAHPDEATAIGEARPATAAAADNDIGAVADAMNEEEERERALDREYWAPLRAELEELRRQRGR